jgi:hypothetical protein
MCWARAGQLTDSHSVGRADVNPVAVLDDPTCLRQQVDYRLARFILRFLGHNQ